MSSSNDNMLTRLRNLFPGIGVEGGPTPRPDDDDDKDKDKDKKAAATQDNDDDKDRKSTDPLAAFAAILDNRQTGDNKDQDTPLSMQSVLTPENLKKITDNLNFAEMISPETRDKLAKGEDPSAIFEAMNEIALGSYTTAIQHASRASELVVDDRMQRLERSFGRRINEHQVQSSLSGHEVIKNSPVLKAGVSMIAERIRQSQPDADPKWITEQATNFFLEAGKALGGGSTGKSGNQGGQPGGSDDEGTDWLEFATSSQSGSDGSTDGGNE